VKDRPGHDRRYAIDCAKAKTELGWERKMTFNEGLVATIKWYLSNPKWIENIKSGAYKEWIDKNYESR
jgi:dTDP-glucose 4,6-dehydratase